MLGGLLGFTDILQGLFPSSGGGGNAGEKAGYGGGNQVTGAGGGVFELITEGEGGLNSVNQGTAGDTPGGSQALFGKDLTDMTVDEIMSAQNAGKVFAVGKYQIIPKTMKGFVASGSVDGSDKFNNATQDKFKDYVINVKRPSVGKYLRGEGSAKEAGQALAREFASVGLQYAENGNARGQSRYAGDSAGNAASISPEEIIKALEADKKKYQGLQTGGMVQPFSGKPSEMQHIKVESGEKVIPKSMVTPEIAQLNESVPRFQSGGSVGSLLNISSGANPIQNFFDQANKLKFDSEVDSKQPIVVPVPAPPPQGETPRSGHFDSVSGASTPSLPNEPSNHIVTTLMMQTYALMNKIG